MVVLLVCLIVCVWGDGSVHDRDGNAALELVCRGARVRGSGHVRGFDVMRRVGVVDGEVPSVCFGFGSHVGVNDGFRVSEDCCVSVSEQVRLWRACLDKKACTNSIRSMAGTCGSVRFSRTRRSVDASQTGHQRIQLSGSPQNVSAKNIRNNYSKILQKTANT